MDMPVGIENTQLDTHLWMLTFATFVLVGGSLGLFAHGPFRIATEKTIFSMPEPSLGVTFNAGASFFLPKLDGDIGTYLALTGTRVEGLDTL
jgi:3-hydroxyisobutyryl-CoA hydrolase